MYEKKCRIQYIFCNFFSEHKILAHLQLLVAKIAPIDFIMSVCPIVTFTWRPKCIFAHRCDWAGVIPKLLCLPSGWYLNGGISSQLCNCVGEFSMMMLWPSWTGTRYSAHTKVIDPRQLMSVAPLIKVKFWHYTMYTFPNFFIVIYSHLICLLP